MLPPLSPALLLAALGVGALAALAVGRGGRDRRAALLDLLPGIDCGACGEASCERYADRLLARDAGLPPCFPLLHDPRLERIERAFGVPFARPEPRIARILCGATPAECPPAAEHQGFADCRAAALAGSPLRRCAVGCLGFGDCAAVCPSGAIAMRDGLPRVDAGRCTGCGLCARECPQRIFELQPPDKSFVVACVNEESAAQVHRICSVGCLACHVCHKVCPAGAIVKLNQRVRIDPSACVDCGLCARKCPTDAIAALAREPRLVAIDPAACTGCGQCRARCPVDAIEGEPAAPHRVVDGACVGCGLCIPVCPRGAIRRRVLE